MCVHCALRLYHNLKKKKMSDEESDTNSHLETKYRVKLYWSVLSANPYAIPLLEKYTEKIDLDELSANPNAISLLEQNPEKINYKRISSNSNAIHIIERFLQQNENNIQQLDMEELSANPNAIHIIEYFLEQNKNNINKVDWDELSSNPNAIPLLEKYPQQICYVRLSSNPNALSLLQKYPDKICWSELALNPNPEAITMFEKYLALSTKNMERREIQLYIDYLSRNEKAPNIAPVLRKYKDYISWYCLSANPNSNAIVMLEKNRSRIDHDMLSLNRNALHLLKISEKKKNYLECNLGTSGEQFKKFDEIIGRKIKMESILKL